MTVHFLTRILRSLSVLLLIVAFTPIQEIAAQDSSAEIQGLMEKRDAEIKSLLNSSNSEESTRSQLKEVINGIIDFQHMSQVALGSHWDNITPQQQDSFVTVFSDIVRAQSISNLDIYRSKISYDKIEVDGDTAVVSTSTVYKDVPAEVVYEMHRNEATGNEWRAGDFLLDGVSTALGYAKSFQTVIRKRGFDGLMSSLLKKQAKMNS